jgi:polyferredoxin
MTLNRLTFLADCCDEGCTRCADYCPLKLNVPKAIAERDFNCIGCLYCFLVCPQKAIGFEGEFGFMAEQLRQYDDITRKISD